MCKHITFNYAGCGHFYMKHQEPCAGANNKSSTHEIEQIDMVVGHMCPDCNDKLIAEEVAAAIAENADTT